MLKQRIFLFEYLFVIYFLLQALFPHSKHFELIPTLLGFGFLSFNKNRFEGLRVIYFLMILTQLLFLLFTSPYIRFPLVLLNIAAILYFPVFKYPDPTGKYKVGYRMQKINGPKGPTSIGVYYPTQQTTKDVPYAPDQASWKRLADLIRFFAQVQKKPLIPLIAFKVSLGYLEHCYLGVNLDAEIAKPEGDAKGFPVVVFSHGLSGNIHIYSLQLKEWASNGFVVFSVDHDEEIHIKNYNVEKRADYLKERAVQLDVRKKTVTKMIDLVHDPAYLKTLFAEQPVTLDYSKLFLAGHSFGGATVAEVGATDKRLTGGLVLLDPWYECCNEELLYKDINVPMLSLRSSVFDKVQSLRERVVKQVEKHSKGPGKGSVVSGLFKDSGHNANSDVTVLMPREMIATKEIKGISALESHVICQTSLTEIFLETALKYKGREGKEKFKEEVVTRFREKLKGLNIEDTLMIDDL